MSSVTTIDPQPNHPYRDSADTANCDKTSACCEPAEHCDKTSPAKMEPNDLANRHQGLSGRRKWLSLAAVSAAITFMVAPFCVGAFQRPATTKAQAATSTGQVAHPNVASTTGASNIAEDANRSGANSEVSIASPSRADTLLIDMPTEKTFGTNYVALREPTENGDRVRIVVFEPNRDVYIHESEQDGIQVRVRRYLFGTSTEQMVSASDVEDLKEQSAEAFELYGNHIGKANLLGPTVSIYPAEEVAWLQPSGFLTALSIDEPKNTSKKSTAKTKKAPGKKESMKKDSQEKESSKKDAIKKPTNSKALSKKDSTKPKPKKITKKNNANGLTAKKMSPKKADSKKKDSDNNTKKKSTPNKKDSKESSPKKSTSQRDTTINSKSEKQADKKMKTSQTKPKVAKSSKEVPSKKNTTKKEAKPISKSKSESNKKSVLQRSVNDTAEMPQLATDSAHTEVMKNS